MRWPVIGAFVLICLPSGPAVVVQNNPGVAPNNCAPKVLRRPQASNLHPIHLQKGQIVRTNPVVSFQILASGNVVNARLIRTSGIAGIDACSLDWARSAKFSVRPGCAVVDSTATIDIDFR